MRTPSAGSQLSRRLLLHALPLATVRLPDAATAAVELQPPAPPLAPPELPPQPPSWPIPPLDYIDPLFGRLRNRYILMRPGETTFEAADIVDSNPINKQNSQVTHSGPTLSTRSHAVGPLSPPSPSHGLFRGDTRLASGWLSLPAAQEPM